jgi:hypothetical protein
MLSFPWCHLLGGESLKHSGAVGKPRPTAEPGRKRRKLSAAWKRIEELRRSAERSIVTLRQDDA